MQDLRRLIDMDVEKKKKKSAVDMERENDGKK